SALVALGFDAVIRKAPTMTRHQTPTLVVATLVGLALPVVVDMPARSRLYLLLSLALIWGAVLSGRRVRHTVLAALLCLLLTDLSLATRDPAKRPYNDLTLFDVEHDVFDVIKETQGLYRTYIEMPLPGIPAFMPKQGTLRGIFAVTDYEVLSLNR